MHRRTAVTLAGLVLAAAGLAACGGDDGGGGGGASGLGSGEGGGSGVPDDLVVVDGTEVTVTALDNSFRAAGIEVRPGTTVTWENKGRNDHDVLPVEGGGWGVEVEGFAPGATYSHTFDEPGVHRYYCSIHGTTDEGMVGTVVVAD
jgi:plastocyanin